MFPSFWQIQRAGQIVSSDSQPWAPWQLEPFAKSESHLTQVFVIASFVGGISPQKWEEQLDRRPTTKCVMCCWALCTFCWFSFSVLTPISLPGTNCSVGKLPKNYDPKVTPDPERWLPMRERSYYRGRKKGKKKDQVGKGTQGSTTAGSSEL